MTKKITFEIMNDDGTISFEETEVVCFTSTQNAVENEEVFLPQPPEVICLH